MKIDVKAAGLTLGIFGALYMLVLQYYPVLTEAIFSGNRYGGSAHFMMEDLYPWYRDAQGLWQAVLGVVFGFIDGFIGGALLAWIYNKVAK